MKIIVALALAALSTAAIAQHRPGGETGRGQNAPDSRDVRKVDEHMNHGRPDYHGHRKCWVVHKHGHSYRKCK